VNVQPIFVGDVQGCSEEFDELLARAEREFGSEFELWSVGDLVNRGPDNLTPLRRVRDLEERGRARVVLGNHEISLLRCWLGLRKVSEFDSFQDVLDAPDVDEWMEWIRSRQLASTGRLGRQPFSMVHASADPSWSLADLERAARKVEERMRAPIPELIDYLRRDPDPPEDLLGRFTRARSVDASGSWSSEEPTGRQRAWHEAWLEREHDYALVYGHWAMQGLHVAAGLRGLDTGCVHHGRGRAGFLTAWVPNPDEKRPFDLPDEHFWSIPARRAYYAHRDARA
jgi:bis(5'-nucleosyl)-tetraphosphatase (symmetrical)